MAALDLLASAFKDVLPSNYDETKPRTGGRPPLLFHRDVLGLTLHYIHSPANDFTLSLSFGITTATCNSMRRLGSASLLATLKSLPEARVEWPSIEQQKSWASVIMDHCRENFGAVPAFQVYPFGFIDGTFCPIPKHADDATQRIYCSGKTGQKSSHGSL